MALFYVNNSLRMHPNQQDMLDLRQKITGAKVRGYERSFMERSISLELGRPIFGEARAPSYGVDPFTVPNRSATFAPVTKTFEDVMTSGKHTPASVANAPSNQD